jgi:HD-like signal output (HDOD) protein
MIDGPALTEVIALGQFKVPPAPAIALRIQRRVLEGNCSPDELGQIASVDPALCAAVLGAANSAEPRPDAPFASVREAVRRIGVDEVVRIALAVNTVGDTASPGPLAALRLIVWRRSLTSAFICRFVAERSGVASEDAFACGLLHDLGWIVALSTLEDLLAQHPEEKQRPAETWLAMVDQFHILLGHITAVRWNLPPLIAEVILCHHQPDQASPATRATAELVAASDRLVTLLEDQPSVSETEVAGATGLDHGMARQLTQALPRVAAATALLLAASAPPSSDVAPSKVARPPHNLRGKIKPVRWDMTWAVGSTGPIAGLVTAVSPDGLVAHLPTAPREGFIVKLAIVTPGEMVEVYVTPLLVEPEGPQQRMEARLFALGGKPKVAWDRMYRTA